MSAFIVNYKTIDNILCIAENYDLVQQCCFLKPELIRFFGSNKYGFIDDKILTKTGKEFLKLNIEAVNQRYNEESDNSYAENYQYKNSKVSLVQSLKSLECLIYQCSEGDCPEKEIFKKLKKLKELLTSIYFYTNKEYNEAVWSDTY